MRRVRLSTSSILRAALGSGTLAAVLAVSTGCNSKSLIDPSEYAGRTNQQDKKVLPVQILDSIDPTIEETNVEFVGATEPTSADVETVVEDYRLSANDLVRITISDLEGPGVQTLLEKRVSETGNISLPYVGQIRVAGSSEAQLEEAIVRAYGPEGVNIIQRANVSVTLMEARGRTFSVLGAVNRPGQYAILQSDFRVLDALVLAGDTQSPLNETLYILRKIDTGTPATAPSTTPVRGGPVRGGPGSPTGPTGGDDLAPDAPAPTGPQSNADRARNAAVTPVHLAVAAQAQPGDDLAPDAPATPTRRVPTADPVAQPPRDTGAGAETGNADSRIINVEGQDLTADPGGPAGAGPTPRTTDTGERFEFNDIAAPRDVRVIRVPLNQLRSGDLKYNIPIRANDRLIVQPLEIGEYYMGGHVARPGAYSLTGRRITLKQAIIAASGLDQLAIPQRTDVIRRINDNQEVFVRVDLAQIFEGQRPDIYLKADDQVMVGTNALAPFLAAARGAFRFTYGLGFIYDRNFAYDQDDNNSGR